MKICSYEDCDRTLYAKGICKVHYKREWRAARSGPVMSSEQRFWSKVSVAGPNECWEWNATRLAYGHGQFWSEGQTVYAHRHSYEMSNGPIPEGMHVDHACWNPPCVNPAHLRLATPLENARNKNGSGPITSTGVRGVTRVRNRFRARVKFEGEHITQFFDDMNEAAAWADAKRKELFGEFCGNPVRL